VRGSAGRQAGAPAMAWLRARARLVPGELERLPPAARSAYAHDWAPVQVLGRHLAGLPPALWDALLAWESGYAVLVSGESSYHPGAFAFRGQPWKGIAFISLEDLAGRSAGLVLHVVGHLVDHHLGCGGAEQGTWLSEGGGMTPAWREAGLRLARLFDLGYGLDEVARSNARDYFAQSLVAYCCDRRRLTAADPQIAKWFRTTLWDPAFWPARAA